MGYVNFSPDQRFNCCQQKITAEVDDLGVLGPLLQNGLESGPSLLEDRWQGTPYDLVWQVVYRSKAPGEHRKGFANVLSRLTAYNLRLHKQYLTWQVNGLSNRSGEFRW